MTDMQAPTGYEDVTDEERIAAALAFFLDEHRPTSNAEWAAYDRLLATYESDETVYPYACADCGTTTAQTYVVTTLDYDDPTTRTEACQECDDQARRFSPETDLPWTVIGYHDWSQTPSVTAVLAGHIHAATSPTGKGSFVDHVRAADATEAVAVALADRRGE